MPGMTCVVERHTLDSSRPWTTVTGAPGGHAPAQRRGEPWLRGESAHRQPDRCRP